MRKVKVKLKTIFDDADLKLEKQIVVRRKFELG